MIVVGLTGGIGSGKTTVADLFKQQGIPVYIADVEAKKLMHENKDVVNAINQLFGESAYTKGKLNRAFIADIVFKDKEKLEALNAIVHPAVHNHFKTWCANQKSKYVIKEAAILFENDGYKQCDYTILVTAPIASRIERVISRDQTTKDKVLERIANQWPDHKKKALADYVVDNIKKENLAPQVAQIHLNLLQKIK